MKTLNIIILFLILVWACKNPVLEQIPSPKLTVSNNLVDLGNIISNSKFYISLKKDGIGSIKYSVSSNKTWLVLDNISGNLGMVSDTIKFHVDANLLDLSEGENTAMITVKSTINDLLSPDYQVEVKGFFTPTILITNISTIQLDTISKSIVAKIVLKKNGLENLNYEAISDRVWVKLNVTSGTVTVADTLIVNIDPTTLSAGSFESKVTITPKVLGKLGKPSVVSITGIYDDTITGNIEGHTLTKNENWAGTINLNGDIIVPKGITLTIKPGTIVKVKKLNTPLTINLFGRLIANGEPSKIIEFRSAETIANGNDWGGIMSQNDLDFSYVLMKNAKVGLNFEDVSLSSFGSPNPNIHHVFFDNCIIAILDLKSNLESTLRNLSFRDLYYFSIKFADTKKVNIQDCEFLGEDCYIDLDITSNNSIINISNSNFSKKKFGYLSHLEVIDGFKNNTITATNCYQLIPNQTLSVNGNKFTDKIQVLQPI